MRINSDPSSPASNTISAIPANAAEPNHGHNIPTDLLTTLLASISDLKSSVNSLQGSISKLQYENKGLREELQSTKTDLMILRENSDVRFPQFSKLPAELRRMIWRFACTAPQIHVISKQGASRSRVNAVMNACTEAKEVGIALKLDYFLVGTRICYSGAEVIGTIKNYVNLDVDTIWLTQNDTFMLFPEDIQWICGKCNVNSRWDAQPCCVGCLSARGDHGPETLRCVAVDFMKWLDPGNDELPMGTLEVSQMHGIKEMLLVVGDVGIMERERDITFVAPSQWPWLTYLYMSRELKVPNNNGLQILESARSDTWHDLEKKMTLRAKEFKLQRAIDRQEAVDSGEISFEEIDSEPWGAWSDLRDVSKWEPPKFRFVEAMKDPQKWTLPPKEKERNA